MRFYLIFQGAKYWPLLVATLVLASVAATAGWRLQTKHATPSLRSAPKELRAVTQKRDEDRWRIQSRCGVNSLYAFMQLLGTDVTYDNVLHEVPIGETGTSMADLKRVLAAHAIASSIIRATPESLLHQARPSIAHLWNGSKTQGHFVVLCDVSNDEVTSIDGTTGTITKEAMQQFSKRWDGYLLIRHDGAGAAPYLWCTIGILGCALAIQLIAANRSSPRVTAPTVGHLCRNTADL